MSFRKEGNNFFEIFICLQTKEDIDKKQNLYIQTLIQTETAKFQGSLLLFSQEEGSPPKIALLFESFLPR